MHWKLLEEEEAGVHFLINKIEEQEQNTRPAGGNTPCEGWREGLQKEKDQAFLQQKYLAINFSHPGDDTKK